MALRKIIEAEVASLIAAKELQKVTEPALLWAQIPAYC